MVDFLGRPYPLEPLAGQDSSSSSGGTEQQHAAAPAAPQVPIGGDQLLPLLNSQPDMDSREQINEPLLTGVKVRTSAVAAQCLECACTTAAAAAAVASMRLQPGVHSGAEARPPCCAALRCAAGL